MRGWLEAADCDCPVRHPARHVQPSHPPTRESQVRLFIPLTYPCFSFYYFYVNHLFLHFFNFFSFLIFPPYTFFLPSLTFPFFLFLNCFPSFFKLFFFISFLFKLFSTSPFSLIRYFIRLMPTVSIYCMVFLFFCFFFLNKVVCLDSVFRCNHSSQEKKLFEENVLSELCALQYFVYQYIVGDISL